MADIINGMSEDTATNCVIFLNSDEAEALEDLLVDWTNNIYRIANLPGAPTAVRNHARVVRHALNDVFEKFVGWEPIADPREEIA